MSEEWKTRWVSGSAWATIKRRLAAKFLCYMTLEALGTSKGKACLQPGKAPIKATFSIQCLSCVNEVKQRVFKQLHLLRLISFTTVQSQVFHYPFAQKNPLKQTNNPNHLQSPGEYLGPNTKLEFPELSPNPEKLQSLKHGKLRVSFLFLRKIMDSPAL